MTMKQEYWCGRCGRPAARNAFTLCGGEEIAICDDCDRQWNPKAPPVAQLVKKEKIC